VACYSSCALVNTQELSRAVDLGAEEKYFPACFACYKEQLTHSVVNASPQEIQKVVGL
jgi:thymidine kinase